MRILGVDPGSRLTGYGCIEVHGSRIAPLSYGTIRLSVKGAESDLFEDRLLRIFQRLGQVIQDCRPDVMVVEKVFFAKNASSALKLGQARGVVLLTGKYHSLPITEYNPTEVKQAVVGHGQADKLQVAKMIQLMTGLKDFETVDASDAMALAICHAQMARWKGLQK